MAIIGSTNLSIVCSLLCVSLFFFASQTLAVRNPRFRWLNKEVYNTLKCYRSIKGFPRTMSPKGALAKEIGLAPVLLDSWNEKNVRHLSDTCSKHRPRGFFTDVTRTSNIPITKRVTMRYNLCVSTLKGFRKAILDTILKTEKSSMQSCSRSPHSIKLTDSLEKLSIELQNTVDALYYQYSKTFPRGAPLLGAVKTFDAGMALTIAHATAKIWPPQTKGEYDPQSLINLVILEQLRSTSGDFTRHNICPVPFLR